MVDPGHLKLYLGVQVKRPPKTNLQRLLDTFRHARYPDGFPLTEDEDAMVKKLVSEFHAWCRRQGLATALEQAEKEAAVLEGQHHRYRTGADRARIDRWGFSPRPRCSSHQAASRPTAAMLPLSARRVIAREKAKCAATEPTIVPHTRPSRLAHI